MQAFSTLPLGLNALAMAVEDEDQEEDETAFLKHRVTKQRTDKSRKRRHLGPDVHHWIREAADVDEEHMVAEALFDLANMFGSNPSEEDEGASPPSGGDEDEEETGEGEEDDTGGLRTGLRRGSARVAGKRTRNGRDTASPPAAERPQRMSTRRSAAQADDGYGGGRPPRNGTKNGRGLSVNGNGTYHQNGKPQPTVSDQLQRPGSAKANDMGSEHVKLANGSGLPPGLPPPGPGPLGLGPGAILDPAVAAALAAGGLHTHNPAQLSLLLSRTGIPPHLLGVPGLQHAAMAAAAAAAAGKAGMLPNAAHLQLPPGANGQLLGHPGLPPWAALPGHLQALLNPALIGKSAADSAVAAALLGHPQHAAQLAAAMTAAQLAAGVHPLPSPGSQPGGHAAGLVPAIASILPGISPEAAALLASQPHMLQHALHAAGGNVAQLPSILASLQQQQQQQAAALVHQQQQHHQHQQLLLQQHQLHQQAAAAAAAAQQASAAQQLPGAQPSASVRVGPTVTGTLLQGSMTLPTRSVTTGLPSDAPEAARQPVRSPDLSGPAGGYKRCALHVHIAHLILDATQQMRQQRDQGPTDLSPVIAQPQAALGNVVPAGVLPDQGVEQEVAVKQQAEVQPASTEQLLSTEAPSLAGSASQLPAPQEPIATITSPAEQQQQEPQQQEMTVQELKQSPSGEMPLTLQDAQKQEVKVEPVAVPVPESSCHPVEPAAVKGEEEAGHLVEPRPSPPLHKEASCAAAETTATVDVAPSGQQAAVDATPPLPVKSEGEPLGPAQGVPYGLPPGASITQLLAQGAGPVTAGLPPHVAAALRQGTPLLPGPGFPLPLAHLPPGLNPQQAALAAMQGLGFPLPPHLASAVAGAAGHQHPLAPLVNGAAPAVSAAPPPAPGMPNGTIPVIPSGPPPSVAGSTVTTPGPRPPSAAPPGHAVQPSLVAAMQAAAGLGGMRPDMVAALMAQNGLAGLPHHLLPRNGDMASLALLAQQQQQAAAAAAVAAAGMDAAKMEHLLRMHGAVAIPGGAPNIAALAAMAQPPVNGVQFAPGAHPAG